MKRTLIIAASLLALAVPAALAAPPADKGKPASPGSSAAAPGQSAEKNAAKWCKAERTRLGVDEFKKTYAPPNHPNGANAFGKCVSQRVKAQKQKEDSDSQDAKNAMQKCKAMRQSDPNGFKSAYGDKPNALGKCASANSKGKNKDDEND